MPYKDPVARTAHHAAYMRSYLAPGSEAHAAHLVRVRKNSALARQKKRDWIAGYLANHPCVDCGEPDPIVLEFDHVRGEKRFNIADAVSKGVSLDTMIAEVAKCEVRCANCHRRVTYRRRMENVAG